MNKISNVKFQHIILTRFNVPSYDQSEVVDKNKKEVLSADWLKKRFSLFERFYVASLASQTNKSFKCLIYFDINTIAYYKDYIKKLAEVYPFLNIIYVKNDLEMGQRFKADVLSLCAKDTEYIITTRLDNDDALQQKAIEKIQSSFKPIDKYALNFCKGYRFVLEPKQILLKNSFINGPFISFIEKKTANILTAWACKHNLFFMYYSVKQIRGGYYWLQTIHDSNVTNDLSGIPTLNKKVLINFAQDISDVKLSLPLSLNQAFCFLFNPKNYVPFKLKIYILEKLGKR